MRIAEKETAAREDRNVAASQKMGFIFYLITVQIDSLT